MLRLEGGEQVGWVKWTEGMGKSKFVIKEHGEGPFKAFRRTKTLTVFVDKFDTDQIWEQFSLSAPALDSLEQQLKLEAI